MSCIVIITGNIGQDAIISYTRQQECLARFSVADTSHFKDKESGEKKEKTEWHNCIAFGKLAEICREVVKKGKPCYLVGTIQYRKASDSQENKVYTNIRIHEIKVFENRNLDNVVNVVSHADVSQPPEFDDEVPF